MQKIEENVIELGSGFYKTQDGAYHYGEVENTPLNTDDIKEFLFASSDREKYVYINSDGKLVLINGNEKKVVDYNIDSLQDIYETVKY